MPQPLSPTDDYNISTIPAETVGMLKLDVEERSDGFILNPKQLAVLRAVRQGKNVFFSGPAGTGKSFLLERIIAWLKKEYPEGLQYAVTAPTGIAAQNICGATIHNFAGFSLDINADEYIAAKKHRRRNSFKKGVICDQWQKLRVLIIDEISFVGASFFDMLEKIARELGNVEKPWGGIQIIVAGDFYQLKPVQGAYAFTSSLWKKTFENEIILTQVRRQTDPTFINMLSQLRVGEPKPETIELIRGLSRPLTLEPGIRPVYLFSTNEEADQENLARLAELDDIPHIYKAIDSGGNPERINKLCRYLPQLELKMGARVMLRRNMDSMLVNGSTGTVVGFGEDVNAYPRVKFDNGTEITIMRETWESHSITPILRRTQLPLTLAWAMTIHKSQGLTIQYVRVDLRRMFTSPQMYVALSRAVRLEGLQVLHFHAPTCGRNKEVDDFYLEIEQQKLNTLFSKP